MSDSTKPGFDQVTLTNMGSDMAQLMTGQADAVTGWLTNVNALKVIGQDRVDMMLWDTGIRLYANVYYATDEQLGEHEDALVRFLRAAARGWEFSKNNQEEAVDILVDGEGELRLTAPRVATENIHGTGCTLSSAVAAELAKGASLREAVTRAKVYVTAALERANELQIGNGRGPVHHFHACWKR